MPISTSEPDGDTARREIEAFARAQGFDAFGIATPDAVTGAGARFMEFLSLGRHGDMAWLEAKAERRRHPRHLWPDVRSIVMLGLNYGPAMDPLAKLGHGDRGNISVYAQGSDYHKLIKSALKRIGRRMVERWDCEIKVFVDTAPVLEKPLAAAAGIGWQGKHTNMVSPEFGSWLFLGAIYTTLDLPADRPGRNRCGSCRRCLDICPTRAFPAPYQLDARRCISYLSIEYGGHIPLSLRRAMGNRIYGCDDCLAVCPWNKFARRSREAKLFARAELALPRLADLAALDDAAFRALFTASPVKRSGRGRILRNVLIAIANSGRADLIPAVLPRLEDENPLIRAMAVWALACLDPERFAHERAARAAVERDAGVLAEWDRKPAPAPADSGPMSG